MRAQVGEANLSQVRQPGTQTGPQVIGIVPVDKQSDRTDTAGKSAIVEKSVEESANKVEKFVENIAVTEKGDAKSTVTGEPVEKLTATTAKVSEEPSSAIAPPTAPVSTAMPKLQSNEVVDLDASATR